MGINSSPSLSQVQSEFGGGNPIGLNEYYGVRFSDGGYAPSAGSISLSNFRNKSKYVAPAPSPSPAPAPAPFAPPSGCFYEETPIHLADGRIIPMKDIRLGDVLPGGITVITKLEIYNFNKVPFYKVYSDKLNDFIYVTGSHHIEEDGKFIRTDHSKHALKTDIVEDMWLCLITSTHNIPIGEHTFWDWADWCDCCEKSVIPQKFFQRTDRFNVY
tara:strand:+ start:1767 stop:2411 length:645 start_codon:yes stop_codon:yes gene_type:complete